MTRSLKNGSIFHSSCRDAVFGGNAGSYFSFLLEVDMAPVMGPREAPRDGPPAKTTGQDGVYRRRPQGLCQPFVGGTGRLASTLGLSSRAGGRFQVGMLLYSVRSNGGCNAVRHFSKNTAKPSHSSGTGSAGHAARAPARMSAFSIPATQLAIPAPRCNGHQAVRLNQDRPRTSIVYREIAPCQYGRRHRQPDNTVLGTQTAPELVLRYNTGSRMEYEARLG